MDDVDVTYGDKKVTITISYYHSGSTVVLMPVWIALGNPKIVTGGKVRAVTDGDFLVNAGEMNPVKMQVHLVDLLMTRSRESVAEKARIDVARRDPRLMKDKIVIGPQPNIKIDGYQLTLRVRNTKEILSAPFVLSDYTVSRAKGGVADLDLLPSQLPLLRRLKPEDVYLHLEGQVFSRLRTTIYRANFNLVSESLTELQNKLGSGLDESKTRMLLYLPVSSGQLQQKEESHQALSQYLVVAIESRKGVSQFHLAAARTLLDKILDSALQQISLRDVKENERIAVMLGNFATIKATMIEIKELSRKSSTDRENMLKTALTEWEKHREKDWIKVGASGSYMGFGGSASFEKASETEKEGLRKQYLETMNKALNFAEEHFKGTVPQLTGIAFDQKALSNAIKTVGGEIEEKEYTTRWYPQVWPPIDLLGEGLNGGGKTKDVVVPNFVGKDLKDARAAAKEATLRVEIEKTTSKKTSDPALKGKESVESQSPEQGKTVPRESIVKVTVSRYELGSALVEAKSLLLRDTRASAEGSEIKIILDGKSYKVIHQAPEKPSSKVTALAFAAVYPAKMSLASGGEDGSVILWHIEERKGKGPGVFFRWQLGMYVPPLVKSRVAKLAFTYDRDRKDHRLNVEYEDGSRAELDANTGKVIAGPRK